MASDESMTILSSMHEDEYDDIDDAGYVYDHQHQLQHHNLSRLSMCTSSMYTNEDGEDYINDEGMKMYMSRLSIESFDGHDADEEFSDEKEFKGFPELSSDSDKEPGCYSLPATPPRRRARGGMISQQLIGAVKDYASENEAQKGLLLRQRMRKNQRRRRVVRGRWAESKLNKKDDQENVMSHGNNSVSGESEGGASGGGVVVITRPKGGKRSLCMDLEEMKACRDLGFELEHERMLEMPRSGSTLDTSSGGNSPIANWRISSPGDDPRDVKARLKVWAQAVALASASKQSI
ncbi:hypothetical protein ACOSP7_000667 [Xanthoceras sorbifolium]|uniref:Fold protein n=1 Tax=Xanthoceras sorbifolium TaxID=99658 RepID=A0ABQ8III3_9ROSI|nr:hypothetical protein JRO89_XS01G0095100 [Xanthoceras sorbifolium]